MRIKLILANTKDFGFQRGISHFLISFCWLVKITPRSSFILISLRHIGIFSTQVLCDSVSSQWLIISTHLSRTFYGLFPDFFWTFKNFCIYFDFISYVLNKTYLESPTKSGKSRYKLVEILITEKVWKKAVKSLEKVRLD